MSRGARSRFKTPGLESHVEESALALIAHLPMPCGEERCSCSRTPNLEVYVESCDTQTPKTADAYFMSLPVAGSPLR
jgi:hypothetical protein